MCNAVELILGIVTSTNFLIFLLLLKRRITKKDKNTGTQRFVSVLNVCSYWFSVTAEIWI